MTENWFTGYRYAICIDRWILHSWWSNAKTVRGDKLGLSSARPFNNKDKTKKSKNLKSVDGVCLEVEVLDAALLEHLDAAAYQRSDVFSGVGRLGCQDELFEEDH